MKIAGSANFRVQVVVEYVAADRFFEQEVLGVNRAECVEGDHHRQPRVA
jgi:hypothetical protein